MFYFLGLAKKEHLFFNFFYYDFPNVDEGEKREWKQEESWKQACVDMMDFIWFNTKREKKERQEKNPWFTK